MKNQCVNLVINKFGVSDCKDTHFSGLAGIEVQALDRN